MVTLSCGTSTHIVHSFKVLVLMFPQENVKLMIESEAVISNDTLSRNKIIPSLELQCVFSCL